jgi:hypothetical protein
MTNDIILSCDMHHGCGNPVTMVESTGWVYCTEDGTARRRYGYHTRKLRPFELNRLRAGQTITY